MTRGEGVGIFATFWLATPLETERPRAVVSLVDRTEAALLHMADGIMVNGQWSVVM